MKWLHFIFFIGVFWLSGLSYGQLSEKQIGRLDSLNTIITENKNDTSVARAYLELTEILYLTNFDTVIVLCQKAVDIAKRNLEKEINTKEALSFKTTLSAAYNNIGYICDDQGRIVEALGYYHKSLKIREELNDKQGIAVSLNNIGIIYVNQGELDHALDYYLKSLEYKEDLGNKKSIATSLNNIAVVYRKKGEVHKSLWYYKRSLLLREELGNKRGISISLNNIGSLYNSINSLDTALEYFQKSLIIRDGIGDKRGEATALGNVGDVYFKKGNISLAKKYGEEFLVLSKQLGFSERIKDAAELLSKVYKSEKKWRKAFEMQKIYHEMKDSLRNEETELASIKEQAKYELEKVEKENKIMAKESDIQTLKLNRDKIIGLSFIIAFALLLILVIVIFRGYRKKILINELLEKQKNEVSIKNEEKKVMIKEIHHRVKNNLQVVSSLLRLQSFEINDESILAMFNESQNRILSMARLHEQMYMSEDLKNIDIEEHFINLIKELIKDYQLETKINTDVKILKTGLGIKTLVPLGLIINEMISNSLKYGFKNKEEGTVKVHINNVEGIKYRLIIGDDGVGMNKENSEDLPTLGSELIETFTAQLNGTINRLEEPGTMFSIVFDKIDKEL
ncbi:MAG: hypothetical protein COB15_05085 [Flavobacteriales bacterium]|nr:MAG: hypothetical protein COB15_05085 [Flavobacteriales bacterium]